jgi:tagaturonate reductase
MKLSRYTLKNITSDKVVIPDEALFDLPEKVLQFGTGVLLRGLPDYFIDKANRQVIFNGRIVVVKSTTQGDVSAFNKQDGLYTHCIRDVENGKKIEENIINSSISRVLDAHTEWRQVLDCAHNQSIQIIVSNTTEVGIQLVQEDILRHPPVSFPGKLLAFLYERFQAFGGSDRSGMVIVPTELVPDNGIKLEAIVLELAHLNALEDEFIDWLENHNHFCSSLVDRIVPGRPDPETLKTLEEELGYSDQLMITSEAYSLWAIEGGEQVKNCLAFASVDDSIIIVPDIDMYRELKLRLLNGTNSLSCGLAFLAGCDSIRAAMQDNSLAAFITNLMLKELAPAIPYPIDPSAALAFGTKVLERYRNPYIQHLWSNITMQYSSKMKTRCIPLLLKHYEQEESAPQLFSLGFAAYLYFMRPVKQVNGKYYGEVHGEAYPIDDEQAEAFYKRWNNFPIPALVEDVLRDTAYWGEDLTALPGFLSTVTEKLRNIIDLGAREAIDSVLTYKEVAV